jgi:hypothetical protein
MGLCSAPLIWSQVGLAGIRGIKQVGSLTWTLGSLWISLVSKDECIGQCER